MKDQALIRQDSEERDMKHESGASSADENASTSSSNETKKTCTDCGTSKTPLWRGGPAGPKSLCNACGIKSRKRRQAAVLNLGSKEKKQRKTEKKITKNLEMIGNLLKQKSLDIRRENLMKRKVWRMLGEEEQAAMLLMSLSCGSVYA